MDNQFNFDNSLPFNEASFSNLDLYVDCECRYKLVTEYQWSQLTDGSVRCDVVSLRPNMTKQESASWRKELGVDRKTFKSYTSRALTWNDNGSFAVLMPYEVYEIVRQRINPLPIIERKSVFRVFAYLYYWAMRFHGSYSHPREKMVRELKINNNTLAAAIQTLEQLELIVRTDYSMRENNRYARRYYIPEELWNYQCRKECSKNAKIVGSSGDISL